MVLSGVFRTASDPSGHLIFYSAGAGKPFYPFTLAATALSFVGVTYYVYKAERGAWWSLPLALLVALVSTVGMVNLYEQVFINFADLVWGASIWWQFYGNSIGTFVGMLVGVSWVFAALPWWRSENRGLRRNVFFEAYLLTMLVWLMLGMPSVELGTVQAYVLNALSRFLSQATLIVLVAKPMPLLGVLHKIRLAPSEVSVIND